MASWVIGLAAYIAVGTVFVFAGPTGRLRHREQVKLAWQACDQPRWKLITFGGAISLGVILLWPILTISAARTEAASKSGFFAGQDAGPSRELDRCISEMQLRYPDLLPLEAYRAIADKLSWTDRSHFDERLSKMSYSISGFVKDVDGRNVPVAIHVLQIGIPFSLTRKIPREAIDSRLTFRVPLGADDAIWEFSSSPESWQHLAGRAGFALVRKGTVIDAYVTMMS